MVCFLIAVMLPLTAVILDKGRQQALQTPYVIIMNSKDGNYEIYRMRPDGTHQRNMTRHPETDSQPSWSPTTLEIVFVSQRGKNYSFEVLSTHANSWRVRNLSRNDYENDNPFWSPDGKWIVFHSLQITNHEVYRVRPDGTGLQNLTQHPAVDFIAEWSQDGEWLYFTSGRDGTNAPYRMKPDGTQLEKMTAPPDPDEIQPSLRYEAPIIDFPWQPNYAWIGSLFCLAVGIFLKARSA